MRVLLEVSHPAHVHFFTPIGKELLGRGHEVVLALRDKDVALALAERTGIATRQPSPGRWSGHRPGRGILARAPELLSRIEWLRALIAAERFDLVVTRNPSGVIAARRARIPSIFDTDDGRSAGLHFWLAAAFASVITSPELLPERLGPRHETYPALKASVFLHPARFSPDPDVLDLYGLMPEDRLFVARFSANDASHDSGVRTIPDELIEKICLMLRSEGHVVLSREGQGTTFLHGRVRRDTFAVGFEHQSEEGIRIAPEHFLHLLANAELFVGDSGSVAMESVALGVPALRIADINRPILGEIQRRLGTIENFRWSESGRLLHRLDELVHQTANDRLSRSEDRRSRAPFDDVVGWFADLAERWASGSRRPRRVG